MNIQYYGDFCFKITTKPGGRATDDLVIVIDPPKKESGFRAPQGQTDILFKTHSSEKDREFAAETNFDSPGEYDIKGMAVFGFSSFQDEENGSLRGQNTCFTIQSEDIVLCHLGALGHKLPLDTVEKIGHVDVLFIPIGGKDTLPVQHIDELIRRIEPAIVVPMHYQVPGFSADIEPLETFCKEIGNCPESPAPKLNIRKKDLEGKSMEIVVLDRA